MGKSYLHYDVELLDNGKTAGCSYVEKWEPYIPYAKGKYPKYDV